MNRNVMNSMIAAMCLGAALSTASVWGDSVYFNCTIDETNAVLDCVSSEGEFEFETGMVEQLVLMVENNPDLNWVIGLEIQVNINNLFVAEINCLLVEGNLVVFDQLGLQCVWDKVENVVSASVDMDTNTKRRRSYRMMIRLKRR